MSEIIRVNKKLSFEEYAKFIRPRNGFITIVKPYINENDKPINKFKKYIYAKIIRIITNTPEYKYNLAILSYEPIIIRENNCNKGLPLL